MVRTFLGSLGKCLVPFWHEMKFKCNVQNCIVFDETFLFRWNGIETKCLRNIESLLILQKALKFKRYFNRNFYTNTIHNTSCKSLMWSNKPCLQCLKISATDSELFLEGHLTTPHDNSQMSVYLGLEVTP